MTKPYEDAESEMSAHRRTRTPAGHRSAGAGKRLPRQGAHVVEMQRRRLLSAIVELLGEVGLEGAGVGRVCKRAGVSRRTFYDLFEDREACFLAAFELALERLAAQVAPAYAGGRRWRERVRGALAALLACWDSEPALARLCLVETLKAGPEVLERRRCAIDTLVAALDEGRAEARGAGPPPLTAESTVGGALAVVHARLVSHPGMGERGARSLRERDVGQRVASPSRAVGGPRMAELLNPLMSMIVLPYLGPVASRRELDQPAPVPAVAGEGSNGHGPVPARDPFNGLPIRITFRTARVLATIGAQPEASNREIAQDAGVADQGQMSKLLARLEKSGLVENHGEGQARGEPNAWRLTVRGHGVLHAVGGDGA
jgi:AcrR family transcriptional regulator